MEAGRRAHGNQALRRPVEVHEMQTLRSRRALDVVSGSSCGHDDNDDVEDQEDVFYDAEEDVFHDAVEDHGIHGAGSGAPPRVLVRRVQIAAPVDDDVLAPRPPAESEAAGAGAALLPVGTWDREMFVRKF